MEHKEVIKKLGEHIYNHHGSQRAYALSINVTEAFVCNVLKGRSEPTNFMLYHIGILKTKVAVYSIIKDKDTSK